MLALVGVAGLLAGCADGSGFKPMYAQIGDGPRLDEKLAAIETAPIPSRVGQRIRNELIFQNTGGGVAATPKFRLDIAIRESIGTTLVRTSGEAASQVYNLDATFTLTDLATKQVVLRGNSHARAGFDRSSNIYSNVRARDDAENRSARTIADDLRSRLSAFLSTQKS
ncbi:MAG: LPS assembly lipoprotein LptE [Hyphomicrobiaceae bacterium]